MNIPLWIHSKKFVCNRCEGKWETLIRETKLIPKTGLWSGYTVTLGPSWVSGGVDFRCCPHCASTDYGEVLHTSGCKEVEKRSGFGSIPNDRGGYDLVSGVAITTEMECVNECPLKDWKLDV